MKSRGVTAMWCSVMLSDGSVLCHDVMVMSSKVRFGDGKVQSSKVWRW